MAGHLISLNSEGWRGRVLCIAPEDGEPDRDQLRAAVAAGAGVYLLDRSEERVQVSLAFLGPVIEDLVALFVESSHTFVDTQVLERADNLVALSWYGRSGTPADFSNLPALRSFAGNVSRITQSVLVNPGLVSVDLQGPIPASVKRIAGPVVDFTHLGARAATTLPSLAHPDALESFVRAGARSFDLDQLAQFGRLRYVRVEDAIVENLQSLGRLPRLEQIAFLDCEAPAGWDDMPVPESGMLINVTPRPRPELIATLRAKARWSVELPREPDAPTAPFSVEHVEDAIEGWDWAIYASDFRQFADAMALVDDEGPASSSDVERMLRRIADELATQGHSVDLLEDSESDLVAVYFRTQDDALLIAQRAREVLATGAQVARDYLGPTWR